MKRSIKRARSMKRKTRRMRGGFTYAEKTKRTVLHTTHSNKKKSKSSMNSSRSQKQSKVILQ
jgi:hypothetical protein